MQAEHHSSAAAPATCHISTCLAAVVVVGRLAAAKSIDFLKKPRLHLWVLCNEVHLLAALHGVITHSSNLIVLTVQKNLSGSLST